MSVHENEPLQTPKPETLVEQEPADDIKGPTSFTEDPQYQSIKDRLNNEWLQRTGKEVLSAEHQDYTYGDPNNPNSLTLEQETEQEFRKKFPDRSLLYDTYERERVYDRTEDDPAYKKLQEEITYRTNMDSQVKGSSKSGNDVGNTWNRVHMRERIYGYNNFATTYPEKAQGYADKWNNFKQEHPEVATMNNAAWDVWCQEHPGTFEKMNTNRILAKTVESLYKRSRIDRAKNETKKTGENINNVREQFDIPTSDNPIETPYSNQKEELTELQLEDIASSIRSDIPKEIQAASRESLMDMQRELADIPYVPGDDMQEILDYSGEDEGVMLVKTDAIVGSVSLSFRNWSNEA